MPTVLRERGFRFVINTDDHPPAHVHVLHGRDEMVIEFEDIVDVRDNWGFRRNEMRLAFQIVSTNRELFLREWRQIHGKLRN